jgi:hypothetical protein
MADKKGVILVRFPDNLADLLRRVSFELGIPIKDIVSEIVGDHLETWFEGKAAEKPGDFLKHLKKALSEIKHGDPPVVSPSREGSSPKGPPKQSRTSVSPRKKKGS